MSELRSFRTTRPRAGLLFLFGLLIAAVLSACGVDREQVDPAPAEAPDDEDVADVNGDEESALGGTAVKVIIGDPSTLNPAITTGAPELLTSCKIFEGLVRIDADFDVVPSLAVDWDVADDGLTYTLNLREDVVWHDGEPFTSADVKWTFENVTREYGPRSAEGFERVGSIETPDDHTVVLHMDEPYGPLLPLMTCANSAILPEHIYGDGQDVLDHPRNTDDPIGTGPFRFDSWDHGQAITLVRNDDYWRSDEGKPHLDRLVLRVIESPEAALTALEAGEVDIVTDRSLDTASYQRLIERDDLCGQEDTNLPTNNVLILNTTREPFDNVQVRQAVFHAINRELIVENVEFGLGNPGRSAIDSRLGWAYNPEVDYNELYSHDPGRAAELLDEAGLEAGADGTRIAITVPYEAGNPPFEGTGQIIRENLRQVGIDVELQSLERSVMVDRVFTQGDFDATIQRYTTFGDVAIGVQRLYISSAIGEQPFTNASGYSNPEVDELFAQGAAAPTPELRAPFYHEVQRLLAEDIPTLVLTENPSADVVRCEVRGMWASIDPYDWSEDVYIEE